MARITNKRTEFSGVWEVRSPDSTQEPRTICVVGNARSGTNLVAAALHQLGVPYFAEESATADIVTDYSLLRDALKCRDKHAFLYQANRLSASHSVWGLNVPASRSQLKFIGNCIPNAQFIIIFRELVALSARSSRKSEGDTLDAMANHIGRYKKLLEFATETGHPVVLIGYETAENDLDAFIEYLKACVKIGNVQSA